MHPDTLADPKTAGGTCKGGMLLLGAVKRAQMGQKNLLERAAVLGAAHPTGSADQQSRAALPQHSPHNCPHVLSFPTPSYLTTTVVLTRTEVLWSETYPFFSLRKVYDSQILKGKEKKREQKAETQNSSDCSFSAVSPQTTTYLLHRSTLLLSILTPRVLLLM